MDKYKKLDKIAKSFEAADRIRNVYNSSLRSDPVSTVRADDLSLLSQILQVIADYSPETSKDMLRKAINKSSLYSNTYKGLKLHFADTSRQTLNKDTLIKTLDLMKPLFSSRHTVLVDKIVKLNEIIKS